LQCICFNPDGRVWVDPIVCKPETKIELESRLLLFYTGITRSANMILEEQKQNTLADSQVRNALRSMSQMAQSMRGTLSANGLDNFGEMLHEGWLLKRNIASGISNSNIDNWYERARNHGAIGGKLLGAGGGGFLLLYAHREHHSAIISGLAELMPVPFRFEPQGSKIIYVEE
jgi:D-glycero-alpha-D-manno-heptose-7-phosphate kinase